VINKSKILGKTYDRDSYDINRAAKEISDKIKKDKK